MRSFIIFREMKDRPASITVIGRIFFIIGVLGLLDTLYDLAHGQLSINLHILMISVGMGLLAGKRSSRQWAKFWLAAAIVVTTVSLAFTLDIWPLSLTTVAACILAERSLNTPESKAYFLRQA